MPLSQTQQVLALWDRRTFHLTELSPFLDLHSKGRAGLGALVFLFPPVIFPFFTAFKCVKGGRFYVCEHTHGSKALTKKSQEEVLHLVSY